MTKAEAIKKIFPDKTQNELSEIWEKVYSPEMTAIFGKLFLDPIKLDEEIKKEYGDYEDGKTSLKDFIIKNFGEEVYKVIRE